MNQRMIRSSLFSLTGLLFVFLVMIGCSSTVRNLSSSFRQQGIAVDSSLNDWTNLLNYDSRSKLYYGVTHDPQYLYVAMQTKDPVVQRKIMAFGLTLWLDTSAKKKKGKGIRYPIPRKERLPMPETQEDKELPLRARQARPRDSRRFLRTTDRENMLLLDFYDKNRQQVDVNSSQEILVSLGAQASTGLIYEVRIPFAQLYDASLSGKKELSIGFVTGHLDVPDRPAFVGNPGGMVPQGGGREGRGRRGGPSIDFNELRESTELWLKGVEVHLQP